jgi:hypothetical protein
MIGFLQKSTLYWYWTRRFYWFCCLIWNDRRWICKSFRILSLLKIAQLHWYYFVLTSNYTARCYDYFWWWLYFEPADSQQSNKAYVPVKPWRQITCSILWSQKSKFYVVVIIYIYIYIYINLDWIYYITDSLLDFKSKLQLQRKSVHTFFGVISSHLFFNLCSVITEEDADRVWACVENAIQVMVEQSAEDEDDEDATDAEL